MNSTEIIKNRIKRLIKMKNEYQGRDNGFFETLIMSQKELLNDIEAKQCKNCKYKGQSVYQNNGVEYIVCWNQGYGIQHPFDWYCKDFIPSDEAIEDAFYEDG